MSQIQPGLNDCRYLSTLQRLVRENPNHPQVAAAKKVFDGMVELVPGKDRGRENSTDYVPDRVAITAAIQSLLTK